MTDVHVLRVFTDEFGGGGNPLGVFLDGSAVPEARRQEVAADLGFSETVYVDDAATGAWSDGPVVWIRARPELGPPWEFVEITDPRVVAGLREPTAPEHTHTAYWAWVDEDGGIIRTRVFAAAMGIHEDEATGSAALQLAQRVGRLIEIWQGNGSILSARPGPDATSEVGGRVALDEVRDYSF